MRLVERLRLDPPTSALAPSQWFAMAGAGVAWGLQHVFGYWVTIGNCYEETTQWGSGAQFWTIVASAAAALVAIAAGLVAVALFRGTADTETHGQAPPGRVRFLSIVGMAVTPLFLAIIVMTGIGASILSPCQTS